MMTEMARELTYTVPRISCASCKALVSEELEELASVEAVDVDLASKVVTVRGTGLDDEQIRSRLAEVGYEATAAR